MVNSHRWHGKTLVGGGGEWEEKEGGGGGGIGGRNEIKTKRKRRMKREKEVKEEEKCRKVEFTFFVPAASLLHRRITRFFFFCMSTVRLNVEVKL